MRRPHAFLTALGRRGLKGKRTFWSVHDTDGFTHVDRIRVRTAAAARSRVVAVLPTAGIPDGATWPGRHRRIPNRPQTRLRGQPSRADPPDADRPQERLPQG